MNTDALILMILIQFVVTAVMVFCFLKVLKKPNKK